MSDQRRFLRWSGRLLSQPINDFWQISTTVQDPSIPNLPLETPAAGGSVIGTWTGTGGMTFAGTGPLARIRAPSASGGVAFAGAAPIARVRVPATSGGITLAGTAALARTRAFLTSGGVVFSGIALLARTRVPEVAGGAVFGGEASYSWTVAGGGTCGFGSGFGSGFSVCNGGGGGSGVIFPFLRRGRAPRILT